MFPFYKTISSLSKAKLFRIMFACAGLAIISVGGLVAGITTLTSLLMNFETAWINTLINWSTGILLSIGGWFVLPAFIVLFAGMFQEKTINRVESVFYPEAMRKTTPEFWPDFRHDIKFTLKALFLNMLVLPFYLLGVGFLLSIILNSYLLGCEFFESAAGHHLGKPLAKELAGKNQGAVYGGGFIIAMMALVPVLNLIMPIIAIVWMTHLYHKIIKVN